MRINPTWAGLSVISKFPFWITRLQLTAFLPAFATPTSNDEKRPDADGDGPRQNQLPEDLRMGRIDWPESRFNCSDAEVWENLPADEAGGYGEHPRSDFG
jgi:hypothetical protein